MVTFYSSRVLYNVKNFLALYSQVIASSPVNRRKSSFIERRWEAIEVEGCAGESFWDIRNSLCNSCNCWSILSNHWSICI